MTADRLAADAEIVEVHLKLGDTMRCIIPFLTCIQRRLDILLGITIIVIFEILDQSPQ